MPNIYGYTNDFERRQIIDKMDIIESKLLEEQSKEDCKRDLDREFELMYAKFIAGLKLSTGARMF
jgi:hypothetical protein